MDGKLMRTLLLSLIILFGAGAAHAQILSPIMAGLGSSSGPTLLSHTTTTSVQANGGSTTGGGGSVINTTGAKFIVVLVTSGNSFSSCTSFSDSAGNTWTPGFGETGADGAKSFYYYVFNPTTSTSHTFTCTGTAIDANMQVLAASGTFAGSIEGTHAALLGSTATSLQTGSTGTLTGTPNEFCFTAIVTASTALGSTPAINSGFTQVDITGTATSGGNVPIADAWFAPSVSTALNPTWSWTTAGFESTFVGCAK